MKTEEVNQRNPYRGGRKGVTERSIYLELIFYVPFYSLTLLPAFSCLGLSVCISLLPFLQWLPVPGPGCHQLAPMSALLSIHPLISYPQGQNFKRPQAAVPEEQTKPAGA